MNLKRVLRVTFVALLVTLTTSTAQADPVLFITTPNQGAVAGSTVDFFGSISNNGSTSINIEDIFARVDFFELFDVDVSPFFDNSGFSSDPASPGFALSPGASTGQIFLFSVFISPFANNITASGFAVVFDTNGVASNRAQFSVTAVPEPTTMILLGTGLAGVVAARRRRRPAKEEGQSDSLCEV